MFEAIELELTDVLKNHGFSRIAIEANTLVIIYNGASTRCDIESSWNKTIQGFKKYTKDLILNKEVLQAVISFISEKWLELQLKRSELAQKQLERLQREQRRFQEGQQEQQINNYDEKPVLEVEEDLSLQLPRNSNPLDYTVRIIQRTVKGEDNNIRIILYAGLSSYTFNPISIVIRAPTSEGKTHLVVKTISSFPKRDVMFIGSMSPKVLIRQVGTLVDQDNVPLQPRINELKRSIRIAKAEENEMFKELRLQIKRKQKGLQDIDRTGRPIIDLEPETYEDCRTGETLEELEDQLQKLYDNSRYIIDLHGKILIFLESPHPDVWNILKPILSHDNWEIEHPHVDTDLKTKNVVTRGWPVCFFCTAKDESRWEIWPEIQSRFIIVSPNMSKEKYEAANVLTLQKLGLPSYVQEQVIVSKQEIETVRKCILLLKDRIRELVRVPVNGGQFEPLNPVLIPYQEYLGRSLPNDKGVEMRAAKYVGSLLQVITIASSPFQLHHRDGKEAIARPEDLVQTLHIIQDLLTTEYLGIPTQKRNFLEEIFIPCYDEKRKPDESADGSKSESIIALTTKELADYYKRIMGRGIDPNNLQKRFLDELVACDLIGKMESEIDKRRQIYLPLIDRLDGKVSVNEKVVKAKIKKFKYGPISLNVPEYPTIKLSKDYKEIPNDWLIFQILTLIKYRIDLNQIIGPFADFLNQCEDFQIWESNGFFPNSDDSNEADLKRLTIREFITKYESRDSISILDIFEPHYKNFYSKIFGSMKEIKTHNYKRYKIFRDEQSYLNFLIFASDIGMLEGTI
jgi:hypothetical protein